MHSDIAKRLKQIISHTGITSAEFSENLKVQKSSISHLLSGRNKPSFDFISKLNEKYPEINLRWFITGKGNMLQAEIRQESKEKPMLPPENVLQKIHEVTNVNRSNVESIIYIYDDNTFKILQKH